MEHVLIGMGYVAQFLIEELNKNKIYPVTVSRSPFQNQNLQFQHIQHDIAKPGLILPQNYYLYYFIPPHKDEIEDIILQSFLEQTKSNLPKKIIYIGSSGIYGEHHGQWVNEVSCCHIKTLRQKQRQHAEQQLWQYSQQFDIPCALLRVAGIYGPGRLPQDLSAPIILENEAPWINHIYVRDLAKILAILGDATTYHGILNVADSEPKPMGFLQAQLAKILGHNEPPQISFKEAFLLASDFKREFMQQNKRLDIHRLIQILKPYHLKITSLQNALRECKTP